MSKARLFMQRYCDWWLPLVIVLPVAWALLPGGLPNTADGPVHFFRSVEIFLAWQDGVVIPRWSEHLGYGYGLPIYVFAAPLVYYVTAALHTFGLGMDTAFKGTMLLGVLAGSYGIYRLARVQLGVWAGVVAATAFVYAPIQLRELFIQGNTPQYLGWAFVPWGLWSVIQLYRADRKRTQMCYGLAVALLLALIQLCHNVVALLAVGTVAALACWLFLCTRKFRALLLSAAGPILGLLLGAWFWLPALLEGNYVQIFRIVASDFRDRFIPLRELVAVSPRLDTSALTPYYPLTLGGVQVWLGALGAVALVVVSIFYVVNKKRRMNSASDTGNMLKHVNEQAQQDILGNGQTLATGVFFMGYALFCGLMATRWSEPIWSTLQFADLFEWPYRWHGLTAIGLSWLCGFGVYALGLITVRGQSVLGGIALLLLIGSALVNLYPQRLLPGQRLPTPSGIVRYEVISGAVGTTSLGEFNPVWQEEPLALSPAVDAYMEGQPVNRIPQALPAGVSGIQVESSAHWQRFHFDVADVATITLNLLYFPGWRGETDDGHPIALSPHPSSGLMDVELPPGSYTLTLTFGNTRLRQAALMISLVAWIFLIVAAGLVWGARRPPINSTSSAPAAQVSTDSAGSADSTIVVVPVIVLLLWGVQITQTDRFVLHSPPDQALTAVVPMRADFGGQIRLLGIDPPPQVVEPGDRVTVVAYWRVPDSIDEDYAIFLHMDNPVTGKTVAAVDQRHPSEKPTSDWLPGLYLRNPLTLNVPEDALPVRYSLRAGIYDPNTGKLLAIGNHREDNSENNGADVLEVAQIWVRQSSPPDLPAGAQIRYGDSIHLLGLRYEENSGDSDDPEHVGDTLVLYWQTDDAPEGSVGEAAPQNLSIFVHILDEDGAVLGQVDGTPYGNQYPLAAWQPGQVIEDRRILDSAIIDMEMAHQFVIGIYDLETGGRLPAVLEKDTGNEVSIQDNGVWVQLQEMR